VQPHDHDYYDDIDNNIHNHNFYYNNHSASAYGYFCRLSHNDFQWTNLAAELDDERRYRGID